MGKTTELINIKEFNAYLSKTILSLFVGGAAEFGDYFSFSIYLQYKLLKTYCVDNDPITKIVDDLLDTHGYSNLPKVQKILIEKDVSSIYDINKEMLQELLISGDPYSEENIWLNEWTNLCINNKSYMNSHTILLIIKAIFNQLGISNNHIQTNLILLKMILKEG